MKKAEAISILATSVRPREAKDRARYDEAVKMAIEALKSSEQTAESAQNVQDEDLISKLSEIRSEYNCFDEDGEPQYRALSEAIRILSQLADGDTISRRAAIDALDIAIERYDEMAEEYQKKADIERNDYMDMRDDAYEARQLAQWLNELKYLRGKIEQLTIKPEQRWIPCSERLPEKNCRCLTTNEAWGSFEVDWNAWIDGQWLYPNEKPIAWMPLPEPYRGGDA